MNALNPIREDTMKNQTVPPRADGDKSKSLDELLSFLKPEHRVMLFIDAANTYMASRALSFDIDYAIVWEAFKTRCDLKRAFYFTAVSDNPNEFKADRPLTDWLTYNKYTLITRPLKKLTDDKGVVHHKGNMDVEISIAIMKSVSRKDIDYAVLFSGDGDFKPLIEECQLESNIRVAVVSTMKTIPQPFIADELRRQADDYVDLADLCPHVQRCSNTKDSTNRRMSYMQSMQLRNAEQSPSDITGQETTQ